MICLFAQLRRLRRDEDGSALVEFGLIVPMILIVFAVTIEGSRLFWSYQATIAGVRDAARYIGRSEQTDICDTGGDLTGWSDTLTQIVRDTSTGTSLFPASITINSVDATLACVTGEFRLTTTPIVTVSALLEIIYPFQSIFEWSGVELPITTTTITDSSRIFGA